MPTTVDTGALGEFAACHYGTFTNHEAAANGINANVLTRLVRDNVVERVRAGVYRFTSTEVTWKHDLYAATLGLHTVASHFSAALLRMVDHAQRTGASMTWLIQRAEKLVKQGRSGPPDILEIVRRRLGGYRPPDSWFERMLGQCLRSPVLNGMVSQYELRTPGGLLVARFDFAVPWARLGIEAHSRSYHLGEVAERYDEDRDMRAAKEGWEISYLGFAATRQPAQVRHDIEEIVIRRATDLGLTPPAGLFVG